MTIDNRCDLCNRPMSENDNWHQVDACGTGEYILCDYCFEHLEEYDEPNYPEPEEKRVESQDN